MDVFHFLESTPKDSVFGAYFGDYKLDIPNIAHRAIFVGNGFLRYMIRIMVGTLIQVGEGRKQPEDIKKIYEDAYYGKKIDF